MPVHLPLVDWYPEYGLTIAYMGLVVVRCGGEPCQPLGMAVLLLLPSPEPKYEDDDCHYQKGPFAVRQVSILPRLAHGNSLCVCIPMTCRAMAVDKLGSCFEAPSDDTNPSAGLEELSLPTNSAAPPGHNLTVSLTAFISGRGVDCR